MKSFLDVRSQNEFSNGHIVNSCNIPFADLETRLNELPPKGANLIVITSSSQQLDETKKCLLSHDYSVEVGYTIRPETNDIEDVCKALERFFESDSGVFTLIKFIRNWFKIHQIMEAITVFG